MLGATNDVRCVACTGETRQACDEILTKIAGGTALALRTGDELLFKGRIGEVTDFQKLTTNMGASLTSMFLDQNGCGLEEDQRSHLFDEHLSEVPIELEDF